MMRKEWAKHGTHNQPNKQPNKQTSKQTNKRGTVKLRMYVSCFASEISSDVPSVAKTKSIPNVERVRMKPCGVHAKTKTFAPA